MSGTRGRKQRPWRTLRCVVEVKVPPSNRSDEGDLAYMTELALKGRYGQMGMGLPRDLRLDAYYASPKVKRFRSVIRSMLATLKQLP